MQFTGVYVKPDTDTVYQPKSNILWLSQEDIPDRMDRQSKYFHAVNLALEKLGDGVAVPVVEHDTPRWRLIDAIQQRVFDHWMKWRNMPPHDADKAIPKEHRYVVWHVWARMHFLLHATSRRLAKVNKAAFLDERRIRVPNKVRKFSVMDLWRAIHMLLTAWNTLKYSHDVRNYVHALACQCGQYFWVSLPNRQLFNHPSFVSIVKDATDISVPGGAAAQRTHYCVNDDFVVETERLFHPFLHALDEHTILTKSVNPEQIFVGDTATSYAAVAEWLYEASRVEAIREIVATDFEELVHLRRAHVGEVERFGEKDQHADATPYNAIASERMEVIDIVSDMLMHEKMIENILNCIKKFGDNPPAPADDTRTVRKRREDTEGAFDADDLTVIAAGYLLDGAFLSDANSFASWFVCKTIPVPVSKKTYPVLVRVFHAYHVVFGEKLWLCANAADAIECWIRQMCSSKSAMEDVAHVAPRAEVFFDAHRKITGGEVSMLETEAEEERLGEEGAAAVTVPEGYDDDVVM